MQPFGGPQAVLAYLSRYPHRVAISNRRLISADETGVTFRWKDYRIERPGRYKTMMLSTHEFIRRFLIHVLPKGVHRIRHYGLFANGHRAANIARARELLAMPPRVPPHETAGPAEPEQPARAAEAMPMLRRPHDHHRDLRAGLPAKASPHTCSADNPDRHLMRPSPSIDNCSDTCRSRRLSAGSARARGGPPQSPALSPRFLSSSVRPTHLPLHAPSLSQAKRSRRPLRSNLLKPHPAAKSP